MDFVLHREGQYGKIEGSGPEDKKFIVSGPSGIQKRRIYYAKGTQKQEKLLLNILVEIYNTLL
jgi:hypothetical protein